jgi:hypothetical protein
MRVFVALSVLLLTVLAAGAGVAGAGVAGAGVAGAGKPSTAPSGNFSVLDVDVLPPEGSARGRPQGVELSYDNFIGNRLTGQRPTGGTGLEVRFQNGFVFNGSLFEKCSLNADAPSDCPSRSRIGRGSAEIDAGPVVPTPFMVETLAYNGRLRNGNMTVIIFAQQEGSVLGKLVGELKTEPRGPYGEVLDFDPAIAPPTAPDFTITQFSLRTFDRSRVVRRGGTRVRRHLIEAPRICRGSWAFAQVNTFENGETLNAKDRDSCVK